MCHRLNIDPEARPIWQKRRALDAEHYAALHEEVERLKAIKFIQELFYPDWLSNQVLMKKPTEKWRTCIDFTNLNKVFLKNSFLLPPIDQLVDAMAGYELLSIMDAYLGYN